MTERPPTLRLDESRMHPQFREREESFRTEASKLWDEEQALQTRIRQNTNLTGDQRLDAYIEERRRLEQRFDDLSEGFSRDVSARLAAARKTLFKGRSEVFARALAQVSSMPDDRLEEAFNAARRAGLDEMQQALAATAYERDPLRRPKIFREWTEANPERSQALELLQRTPGAIQMYDRSRAMRPPRAAPDDLEPTAADLEEAAEEARIERARRLGFLSQPSASGPHIRRQVGRRTA